jgi:hypothetical protein
MMKRIKDWRGNPIGIGSRVVWPTRQGSGLWMNEGVVESIEPIDVALRHGFKPEYKVGVRRIRESGYNGVAVAAANTGIVYPSVDRLTATGFFTAGTERDFVVGAASTERMVGS